MLDDWAVAREAESVRDVGAALDAYDFMKAGRLLEAYINDLSTWYLRRSRQREDVSFFASFHERLSVLLKMTAPFMPFMSEYLYREIRNEEDPISVHLCDWPVAIEADEELLTTMRALRRIAELGQSVRSEAKLKVRQPLATAWVAGLNAMTPAAADLIAEELNVLEVVSVGSLPEGMPHRIDGTFEVALDPRLNDSLLQAGQARDLIRQLQSLRKDAGMQPGEAVTLLAGPFARALLEPLFENYPETLTDASIRVDPATTWSVPGESPLLLNGETVYVTLRRH